MVHMGTLTLNTHLKPILVRKEDSCTTEVKSSSISLEGHKFFYHGYPVHRESTDVSNEISFQW